MIVQTDYGIKKKPTLFQPKYKVIRQQQFLRQKRDLRKALENFTTLLPYKEKQTDCTPYQQAEPFRQLSHFTKNIRQLLTQEPTLKLYLKITGIHAVRLFLFYLVNLRLFQTKSLLRIGSILKTKKFSTINRSAITLLSFQQTTSLNRWMIMNEEYTT